MKIKLSPLCLILVIVFILGLLLGGIIEKNVERDYDRAITKLSSYNTFCELNSMGKLKSYSYSSFTCSSGTEIPNSLVLGRNKK